MYVQHFLPFTKEKYDTDAGRDIFCESIIFFHFISIVLLMVIYDKTRLLPIAKVCTIFPSPRGFYVLFIISQARY